VNVRITVGGADRTRTTIDAIARSLSDLTMPLQQGGDLTRDEAVRQFAVGGDPRWPPSQKTLSRAIGFGKKAIQIGGSGQTGIDTGTLRRSITSNLKSASNIEIGTNVPYARWFQEGSGIYVGHSAWTITPTHGPRDPRGRRTKFENPRRKNKGASLSGRGLTGSRPAPAAVLAWSMGGHTFFARTVTIKGQPPRPFLFFSPPLVAAILERFRRAIDPSHKLG
jgi:phage gpG-like protein